MFPRVLAPIPLAVAALIGAAIAGPLAPQAQAAQAAASRQAVRTFDLSTGLADGKMVFLDAKGAANPTLRVEVGDVVEIRLRSGEGAVHDIAIPDLKVQSRQFDATSGPTTVRFKVTRPGRFTYFCTIAGHRQIGMEGVLDVAGDSVAANPPAPRVAAPVKARHAFAPAALKPAVQEAVSIAQDPTAVPPALGARPPQLVKYRIETVELDGRLDDGTTFNFWTFDRKVPGPMLRVRKGDTIELTLANDRRSRMVHSIDLHAVTGGHGGGADTQVAPGQEKTVRFKALNPGLYVYHCATPSVPHHISAGMYGLILVEPEEGLPPVDREFYVMQGDLYTTHAAGAKGHQEFSDERASDELPTYYTFNGAVGALTKEFRLTARVGETVRIFFGVGGPNKVSSFHVIGEIFDKIHAEGSIGAVRRDVQTTLVAPGGATIAELRLDYPGNYVLVDHALSRVGKGLAATLEVTGPADPAIYQPIGGSDQVAAHTH